MISSELDFMFTFKCKMRNSPYQMLIILVVLTSIPLAYFLHIIESPVENINNIGGALNNYKSFDNCLWNVFIIITTVGYGDYYPISTLGRLAAVMVSLIGIVLVSLIIMTLQNSSKFSSYEAKSKDFIDRLNAKLEIKEQASNYFKETLKFLMFKSRYIKGVKSLTKVRRSDTNGDERERSIIESEKQDTKNAAILQEALIKRLNQKLNLKTLLKNFHRDYEPYDPMSILQDKVKDLDERLNELADQNQFIEEKLGKILTKLS